MKSEKRVLFLLAASAVVILLVTVLTLFSGKEEPAGTKKPGKKPKATAGVTEVKAEHNKLMMVKSVDTGASTIVVYDLEDGGEVTLSYDVAADIRSKYGSLTYAASLTYGQIVRAEYDGEGRLVKMQLSGEHWELHGVEAFSITDSTLTVNNTTYKLTEATIAYCEGEKIALGEVRDIDRVELCGMDSELLTVRVVKGHGSIKLVNCTEFQGAKVTFKDESHVLEGEPTYLVREGNYTVSVVGEKNAAAAEVTVARNEQVVIDLYEYGGAPVETAEVRFKITPFSTVLKIDGEQVDYYEQDLVLTYGEHEVVAELGGYVTYKAYLTVSRPYHTFRIDLQERPAGTDGTETDGPEDGDSQEGSDGSETEDGTQKEDDNGSAENPEGNSSEDSNGENSGGEGEETGDETDELRDATGIGEALGLEYNKEQKTIISMPKDVIVEIEGFSIGKTPVFFEKILGSYTIALRKNDEVKEYTVTVIDDGEEVEFKFPGF